VQQLSGAAPQFVVPAAGTWQLGGCGGEGTAQGPSPQDVGVPLHASCPEAQAQARTTAQAPD
jgi:hypothetical protein